MNLKVLDGTFIKNFFSITGILLDKKEIPKVREKIKELAKNIIKKEVETKLGGDYLRIDELRIEINEVIDKIGTNDVFGLFDNFDFIKNDFINKNINFISTKKEAVYIEPEEFKEFLSYLLIEKVETYAEFFDFFEDNKKIEINKYKKKELLGLALAENKIIFKKNLNKYGIVKRNGIVYEKIKKQAILKYSKKNIELIKKLKTKNKIVTTREKNNQYIFRSYIKKEAIVDLKNLSAFFEILEKKMVRF